MILKVAVIGAGPCGLAALRRLSERPETFTAVAFEQGTCLGGNWVYTDVSTTKNNELSHVHSSVYKNLRTNLAKESMFFPDYPFPSDLPSYVMHWDMLQYLQNFAQHFDLSKYIKFSRKVVLVKPLRGTADNTFQWYVEVQDMSNPTAPVDNYIFDAVLLCNGHFSVPRIPDITGLKTFEGQIIHSHYYRDPQNFSGKRVVCVGGGHSGADISLDISSCASKVFWSHSNCPYSTSLPSNMEQILPISEVKSASVLFSGDREEAADVIVLCTGYQYKFPFLDPSCCISVDKGRVKPLYKHIINIELPTLNFIGICTRHCSFPQFDGQVLFALASLDGSMPLPSIADMKQDAEDDYCRRLEMGICHKKPHELAWAQWDYHLDLARLAHFTPWPAARRSLCENSILTWNTNLPGFRKVNYEITDETKPNGYRAIND